jgi:hypothetical protein
MHDLLHRLAVVFLFAAGLATLGEAFTTAAQPALWARHHQALIALTGAALVAAPWFASLRAPAVAVALVSRLTLLALAVSGHGPETGPAWLAAQLLQLVLLASAGVILAREARQEARWNAGWRQEG